MCSLCVMSLHEMMLRLGPIWLIIFDAIGTTTWQCSALQEGCLVQQDMCGPVCKSSSQLVLGRNPIIIIIVIIIIITCPVVCVLLADTVNGLSTGRPQLASLVPTLGSASPLHEVSSNNLHIIRYVR